MAKALVCDKCGKVVSTKFGQMRRIEISPYINVKNYSDSNTITFDLCETCSEQLLLDIKKKEKDE